MALPDKFIREKALDAVREEIRPDGSLEDEAREIIARIQRELRNLHPEATCILGGSVAKGSYLKGNHDIDLFIRFPKGSVSAMISGQAEEVLHEVTKQLHVKLEKLHGSRDYFQFVHKGITVEAIPTIKISSSAEAENVTDVSPLHVEWVAARTAGNPVLCDEIRLSKQFCKSAGVYGAESYISGFSGHVLDILTIHYGSFIGLVSEASNWKLQAVIDPERHLADPLKELNASKTESPLVLVDPVDKARNAAAALSRECYDKLKKKAKEFLSVHDEALLKEFFVVHPSTIEDAKSALAELKATGKSCLLLSFSWTPLKGKRDVVGSKLLKAHSFMAKKLEEHEFKILKAGWSFGFCYFIVSDNELSAGREITGPPKQMENAAEGFRAIHGSSVFLRGERYMATVKRKHRRPESLARQLLLEGYLREKIESISLEIM